MPEERKLIPGVEVDLAGEKFILPPLTLGQLRGGVLEKMRQNDALMTEGKFWEALDIKCEVITAALQRNYPNLSIDDVSGMVDLRNWDKVWEIVLGGTGQRSEASRAELERPASPNPTPVLGNGILDPSTDPSPELTVGLTNKSTATH